MGVGAEYTFPARFEGGELDPPPNVFPLPQPAFFGTPNPKITVFLFKKFVVRSFGHPGGLTPGSAFAPVLVGLAFRGPSPTDPWCGIEEMKIDPKLVCVGKGLWDPKENPCASGSSGNPFATSERLERITRSVFKKMDVIVGMRGALMEKRIFH